jgi:tRNA threonylcarbamoyladenosine biosynthesis protein TsaB
MRILALETTSFSGSLALLEAGQLLYETRLPVAQSSAQSLASEIELALRAINWPVATLQLIAVTVGPGSFTGLRVGITTAKTLAYALSAEILGVDTLDVLAQQVEVSASRIHCVLDAQRNELFAATYVANAASRQPLKTTHIVSLANFLEQLQPGDIVCGPVLSKINQHLPTDVIVAPEKDWQPRAATIGVLAWQKYLAGERGNMWKLLPEYHRPSYAEEKRA